MLNLQRKGDIKISQNMTVAKGFKARLYFLYDFLNLFINLIF